jgi:hypothetical protein
MKDRTTVRVTLDRDHANHLVEILEDSTRPLDRTIVCLIQAEIADVDAPCSCGDTGWVRTRAGAPRTGNDTSTVTIVAARTMALPRQCHLAAHAARYRRARRMYPGSDRGHAWKMTR